jgi:hypothetical protein
VDEGSQIVSEYQYYEFLAIDRPLTKKQIDEVRRWSTRAEITSTSFVNEYHFGDFHGSPELLVSKYFDVMVYFANWGTHRLLTNVPVEDVKELKKYESDSLTVHKQHDGLLVDFNSNSDDYDDSWDMDSSGLMGSLSPIRTEIAGGDLRPLFLGWLSGLYFGEEGSDNPVPPIPEGLNDLTPAQTRLAEYLRVDEDILMAAANHSAPKQPPVMSLPAWVVALPPDQKNDFIEAVMSGSDPAAVNHMRRRYQLESAPPENESKGGTLTVGQVLLEARTIQKDREEQERAKRKRDAERRARQAAEEWERRINDLMRDELPAWKSVESIVGNKQAGEYARAVKQLADLKEVAVRRGALEDFARRVRQLRETHKGKRKFVASLDAAKLL